MRIACIQLARDLDGAYPYWPTSLGLRPRPELEEVVADMHLHIAGWRWWPGGVPACRLLVVSSSYALFGLSMWAIGIGVGIVVVPLSCGSGAALGYEHPQREWMVVMLSASLGHQIGTFRGVPDMLTAALGLIQDAGGGMCLSVADSHPVLHHQVP